MNIIIQIIISFVPVSILFGIKFDNNNCGFSLDHEENYIFQIFYYHYHCLSVWLKCSWSVL
jgi:hypothetical protein